MRFPQYNWDRKGSTVESTLGSDQKRGGGALVHQSDKQFVGFSPDKKRYLRWNGILFIFSTDIYNAL